MAKRRSELDQRLHSFCDRVYFQPPNGYKLVYPCIVYDLAKTNARYADNAAYALHDMYTVKYITRDPDDPVRSEIIKMELCSSDRTYTSDNLYHHVYSLFW